MPETKMPTDPAEILNELEGLREAADAGEAARARAVELIEHARAEDLVPVAKLAVAYGVTQGRVYQLVAPNYRR